MTAAGAMLAVYGAAWWTLASFALTTDAVMVSVIRSICWLIFLEMVILVPLVMWWGIRLTHRVAGPLVRIHGGLARLIRGDYAVQIRLRAGDELQDLAAQVNALAEVLQRR
jgi:signal transduction histidine kinase